MRRWWNDRLRFADSGFRLAHGGGKLDRMAPEPVAPPTRCWAPSATTQNAIAELHAKEVV
jgi:hypothetical protein